MFKGFFRNVCETFGEKKEADMNEDIKKMSSYISKNYGPKGQAMLLKGIKYVLERDLSRDIAKAEEVIQNASLGITKLKEL